MRENKLGVKKKAISRVFAITLSFLVAFSGINPAIFASADNGKAGTKTINHAVRISFAPQTVGQEVKTGQKGAFILHAEAANANNQKIPIDFKVRIPDNNVQLPDFKDGDTFVSRATRLEFTLKTDKDGYRYICGSVTLTPGEAFEQSFQVFYPNGVTPNTELTVTEDDITVDKPASIPGNIIKEGGTIKFKSSFAWEPLNITANVEKLKADAKGILTKDIIYTLTAQSMQGPKVKNSGSIYTKEYTLTDVITLPAGITFPTGALSWEDNNKVLMSGTMKVAEFTAPIESAQISEDGRTLTFVHKKTNDTLAEVPHESENPKETEDLNLQVTLNRHALTIDFSTFNEDKTIDNNGTFNAVPCLEAKEHNSSDAVPILLPKPGDDFEVEKNSIVDSDKLKNGGKIKYTITVRNNNPTPIVVDIKDSAPENTTYIEGTISDNGTVTKTSTGTDMLWTGVKIDAGSYVTRNFQVTINSGLADGTIIENTAEAVYNGVPKVSNTVKDKYYAPAPDLDVEKTNNKVNQMVSEGGTVTFTIKVTNNGDEAGTDTIIDTLSNHLVLDESSLPADANYDGSSRKISIPVTLDPGSSKTFTFKCKVQAASWIASGTSIGNTALLKDENEKSTTSFLYKEKKHNLSVVKSMENMVDLGDNLYQVSYRLTISNKGGPLWASQGEKVTDTMSGGLIPLEVNNAPSTRTANGTWTTGNVSKEITAPITKETLQSSDQYVTTWELGNIAAGQKATIDYKAVVRLENGIMDMANTTNVAQIWKKSGNGVMAVPYPSSDKVISSINGKAPAQSRYSEIHPGDVVTYKLTIKNTGTGTQHNVLLTDALPDFNSDSGFKWEINKNVKLDGSFSGSFDGYVEHSTNALVWRHVNIKAKSTQTVNVTLTFPKGAMFDKAFSEDRSKVYNTFTFQTDKLKQVHKVTHDTVPVTLDITKEAENRMALTPDKPITFTIDGFSADYPVENLKVTDNLEKVSDSLAATSILTGSYQISGKDNYNIILSYEGEKSDQTINVGVSEGNKTITLTAQQQENLKSIAWDFGTVDSLKINATPQLMMTAKAVTKPVTATNYVNVVYNQRMAGDDIEVKVMPNNMISKDAYIGGFPVDNKDHPAAVGDKVEFVMKYTNYQENSLDMTKVTVRDMLTTKGLKPDQNVNVSVRHLDSNGTEKANSDMALETTSFIVTAADTKSPLAKKVDLKFSNGTLAPGETVEFTYNVILGEGFEDSMGDINLGYTDNYDGKMNLRALHNEMAVIIGGESYNTQTGFYYQEGDSEMYFQKGVLGIGTIDAYQKTKDQYRLYYGLHYSDYYTKNVDCTTEMNWYNNHFSYEGSSSYTYNMAVYSMVVYNNDSSPRVMTVDSITDQLPEGAVFYGMSPMERCTYKEQDDFKWYNAFKGKISSTTVADTAYRGHAAVSITLPTEPYNNMKPENLVVTSKGYKTEAVKITPNYNKSSNKVSFALTNPTSGSNLVLDPGDMVAFAYMVAYPESVNPLKYNDGGGYGIPKYSSYTNNAILKVEETGFKPLEEGVIKTKYTGTTKNDGGCIQTSSNSYESSVTIKEQEISVGLTKKAVARYTAKDKTEQQINNAAINGTLANIADRSTNMDDLGFNDIVEWEITIDYTGTGTELTEELVRWQYGTITDQIPEPYRIISNSSGKNLIMEYADGNKLVRKEQAVTVASDNTAFFGDAGQTFVWQKNGVSNSNNPDAFDNYVPTAKNKITLRYYTRYDDSLGKAYINYNNVAKYEFNQRGYVDNCTAGQPIKTNGKITAITAEADVFPGGGDISNSYKAIEYSDATPTEKATSLDDNPKIEVPKNKVLVDYTLNVKNESNETYKDLVLIDRLPEEGDVGTVNSAAQRGSQFSVDLTEEPQVKVFLVEGTESNEKETLIDPLQYTISYTSEDKEDGYTAEEWAGTDNTDWNAKPENANSIRVALNQDLEPGKQIRVVFKAYVSEEADPGEVAWGSFGFRYENPNGSGKPTYAEPAKVGVELPSGSLSVIKKSTDNKVLANAEFTLYADENCVTPYTKNGTAVVIKTDSNGKGEADGLALDTTYWIKETKAPDGYKKSDEVYEVTLTEQNPDQTFGRNGVVTNEPEEKQGDFYIAKRVEGTPADPDETFEIIVSGNFINGINQAVYNLKDGEYAQVLGTISGETYTVTESYSEQDQYIPQYTVTVGGSTTSGNKVTMSETDCTVLIENHDKVDGSLYITKKVNGDSNGETFKINVSGKFFINGEEKRMTETVSFTPDEYGVAKEVKNVIAGEEYVISEQGSGYIAEITASRVGSVSGNTVVLDNSDANEIEITNTEATEVSGIKTWNDGNNEENRPDEIAIQLYQNGQKYSSDLYPEGQTTTNADSNWEYSFSQLPKYNEEGQPYEYTIEEVATDNLADNYIGIVDEYDITNTSTIDLDGEKIWLDGNDKEGKRPNSIKIQLYQGIGTDKSKYEPYGEELEIKKADDWKYTYENLPEYDADGNRYIYTIKEVDVPNGYEVSYPSSGEAAEGESFDIDIVNSLLIDICGEKIWKDFFDSSDRPDEITVQLIRYIGEIQEDMDPEIIGTAEVTAADGWKYSFTELPAYTPNGVAYTYDVIEITEVEGYTCNNDIEGSYDIVNTKDFTFVPPPGPDPAETIELSGEKIWKDDSSPNRPDEITIQLYQMVGSDAQTMTEYGDPVKVTYSDRWKYSFTALPKYDASGTAYTYMVKEVEVPEGYIVSYEGTDIINTKDPDRDPTEDIPGYTPPTVKLSVGGQKIWDDMDDYAKMRPDEITVQLYQDGVAFGDPVTITAEDDWKYSFNDLPKFDAADPNSVDYVYTIEEVNVPEGYAVRYDGYNIINDIDDKYLPKPPEKATDTGDHSNVLFWTLQLMLLSAICMILVLLRRKKPTRNNY